MAPPARPAEEILRGQESVRRDALRRLRSEPFALEHACPWAELGASTGAGVLARHGILLDAALDVLPAVSLDATAAKAVGRGQGPCVEPGEVPLAAGPRSVVLRAQDGRSGGAKPG